MQKKKQDRTGLTHGEQSLPAMTHWAGASVGRHALPALAYVYRTQSLVFWGGARAVSSRNEAQGGGVGADLAKSLGAHEARDRPNFYDSTVQRYSEMPIHRLTIHELLSAGSNVTNERLVSMAQHVQRELCIRLARRLLDIQTLPFIVVANPHIERVHALYRNAFEKLVALPKVVNIKQDEEFVHMLKNLVQEGVQVVPLLARGTYEASLKVSAKRLNCDRFLGDMVMSRISRRVIAEQFIALHHARPGYVGVICKELSVLKVIERVAPEAAVTCERTYGVAPAIQIEGERGITCSYIPTHLEYIVFELLKNAMRAVCETHLMRATSLPPIKILLTRGPSDITLRISDQGGGVPKQFLNSVFDFGFSTVHGSKNSHSNDSGVKNHDSTTAPPAGAAAGHGTGGGDDEAKHAATGLGAMDPNVLETSPMAGLGFGLPVSRLYAQYFGGDVCLVSMEGYGSDVYVRLDHIGKTAEFSDYDGFDIWRSLKNSPTDDVATGERVGGLVARAGERGDAADAAERG